MEFLADCGLQVAVIGSALAVGLACAGSGRGRLWRKKNTLGEPSGRQ